MVCAGGGQLLRDYLKQQRTWGAERDGQLLEALHTVAEGSSPKLADHEVTTEAFAGAAAGGLFSRFAALMGTEIDDALGRLALLRLLNMIVGEVLPLIDFGPSRANWSLAHKYVIHSMCVYHLFFSHRFDVPRFRLSALRDRLFLGTKDGLWRGIMNATMARGGQPRVQINRAKSIKAHERTIAPPTVPLHFRWWLTLGYHCVCYIQVVTPRADARCLAKCSASCSSSRQRSCASLGARGM